MLKKTEGKILEHMFAVEKMVDGAKDSGATKMSHNVLHPIVIHTCLRLVSKGEA